ncbi:MAG: hypothetical protein E7226_00180 [Clostridiales bacterium]|nr:hypothetical protein [Clostridiales bacterium]
MKSTISKTTYQAIYRLLDMVSPVDFDCGILCGAACCLCDYTPEDIEYNAAGDENADQYMGLMLLPGEEKVFDESDDEWIEWGSLRAEEYDYPDSWRGRVPFIQCRTAPLCKRNKRPIQCRTFPLSPHIDEDGIFHIILCADELPYECPLIRDFVRLNDDFIRATYTCWKHLIRDHKIMDLVLMDSEDRTYEEKPLVYLYP